MASPLDLQEQEQLDDLKAFWKTYGNLITWLLVIALGAFAAWSYWKGHQREQGFKAGAMFDELERAAQAGDVDKTTRIFADMKERYPGTAFTQQGGLAAAKLQFEKEKPDLAKASLTWVADAGVEDEVRTIARLRLAGILLDGKQFDEALRQLDSAKASGFEALVADRRGDVLAAQGKIEEAKAAYQSAWKLMDEKVEYRRLIDAKLTALGAAPAASAAASVAAAAASVAASAATP